MSELAPQETDLAASSEVSDLPVSDVAAVATMSAPPVVDAEEGEVGEDEADPFESLLKVRAEIVDRFNDEVRAISQRQLRLSASLDQLQNAKLVRLDPTICPRNTLYEHSHYYFSWHDAESTTDVDTLVSEKCLGHLCEFRNDAENAIWLRQQTIWNRFSEGQKRLDELNRDRTSRLKQIADIDEQLQIIRQTAEFNGDDSGLTMPRLPDAATLLLNPSEISVPQIQQPVAEKQAETRTHEEIEREIRRLVEAVESGSFDQQLGPKAAQQVDCRTLIPQELHGDAQVWKACLKRYPDQLENLPEETLSSPKFALELLNSAGALPERIAKVLPESLRNDVSFILKLIEQNWRSARDVCSAELKDNPDVAIKALRYFDQDATETMTWIGAKQRDNGFVMTTAVLICPATLKFASDRLRGDRDFVQDLLTASLALCEQSVRENVRPGSSSASAFDWRVARRENSRYRIAGRKDFANVIESLLDHVLASPRDDQGVMTLALLHDAGSIEYASSRLRESREFAQASVEVLRDQLPSAVAEDEISKLVANMSPTLLDDEEFALLVIAATSGRCEMEHWSDRLKATRQFALRAFNVSLYRKPLLQVLSPTLRDDEEVVLTALMTDGNALLAAADRLQRDRRFVLKALHGSVSTANFEQCLQQIRHHYIDRLPPSAETNDERYFAACRVQISVADLPESLRSDRELVLASLESGGSAKGTAASLLSDIKFATEAVRCFARKAPYDPMRLRIGERLMAFLPDRVRDNEDVLLAAVRENGTLARFASARLKADPKFATKALSVTENPGATLEHLSHNMRDNDDVMQATAKINADLAVRLASERLKGDWDFAQTVLTTASDPDRFRSKLSKAIEGKPQGKVTSASATTLGMTSADWWALLVVVLGASLVGYIFVAVPKFDEQIGSTTIMQGTIVLVLVMGLLFSLNQVLASRRSSRSGSTLVETLNQARRDAELDSSDDETHFSYSRDGQGEVSGGRVDLTEDSPPSSK